MKEKVTKAEFSASVNSLEPVIIYHLKTTGLDPAVDSILCVESILCFKALHGAGYVSVDEATWYINPGFPLNDEIQSITGITNDFLECMPLEKEAFEDIANYFADIPICGFNNHGFDDPFMAFAYDRQGSSFKPKATIDTFPVSFELFSPGEIKNYRLDTLYAYISPTSEPKTDAGKILNLLNEELIRINAE